MLRLGFILSICSIGYALSAQEPKTFDVDSYHVSIDQTNVVKVFYGELQLLKYHSLDGFLDTVKTEFLNADVIPDFLIEPKYCDGSELIVFLSESSRSFSQHYVSDMMGEVYCLESGDTLATIQSLSFIDLDEDGIKEILINHFPKDNQLISISCSDTFFFFNGNN